MQLLKKYFFPFIAIPIFSFAQDKNEESINWSASRQLTWSDYKGKPEPGSTAAASTSTYLGIEYNFNDKVITYKIQCSFSKTRSWGTTQTDWVLRHEQGHFDITEIFARKLNKKMGEYQFNIATYKNDLKIIYDEITAEKEALQEQYDNETDHSRKKEQQEAWLKKIKELLNEYQSYAGY